MAAVEVTISGVLYDKYNRTQQNVVLIGEAVLSGLQVGGGPVIPPSGGPPGIWGPTDPRPTPPINLPPGYPGSPPGIWGPTDPRPTPPIAGIPGLPGYRPPGAPTHPIVLPPGIWPNPPEGQAPHPEHPIVIPPPPGVDGPRVEVKVGWTEQTGWFVVLVPTGEHPAPAA